MNRRRLPRFLSPAATVVVAALILMPGAVAQRTVEPGTTATFGSSDDVSTSVSDCGGLNSCGVEWDTATNTVGAVTALSGIGSTKTARVTLLNRFRLSGDSDRALDAQLSGRISWEGDLQSLGVIGAAAFVTSRISVVDVTTGLTVGGRTVLDEECETNLLFDTCLRRIEGSSAVNLDLRLQRGREYEIRFLLECQSNSGAGDANCAFNRNGAFPLKGGFAERSDLALTVDADVVGLLEEILEGVEGIREDLDRHDREVRAQIAGHDAEIRARLDAHDASVHEDLDRNWNGILEAVRLMLTPQGRRETGLPACDGIPCAFPDGADAAPPEAEPVPPEGGASSPSAPEESSNRRTRPGGSPRRSSGGQ